MTFGFTTAVDFLSWAIAVLLGMKVVATIILLSRERKSWFQARWTLWLWWVTKVTPVFAVPCLFMIGVQLRQSNIMWISVALLVFVLIAVPVKIRSAFYRTD